DFLLQHRTSGESLGRDLQKLRRSLNHSIGRIQKARTALEQRSAADQVGLREVRREVEIALNALDKSFSQRRNDILSDALTFEGGKRSLRQMEDIVRSIRCIEDMVPSLKSAWSRLLN